MSKKAKQEYLLSLQERYTKVNKEEKKKILDEFCTVCDYNRKYAIRILNSKSKQVRKRQKKRGPKPQYDSPEILDFIIKLWKSTNLICSKRLKAVI